MRKKPDEVATNECMTEDNNLEMPEAGLMGYNSRLEQASPLYEINKETQTLDIFIDNDVFSKSFELSMLTRSGIMSEANITGFEMVNDKTLRITVSNLPEAGEGSLTFCSNAFEESKRDLTVVIKTKTPQIYLDGTALINEKNPIVSFMTNIYLNEQPELTFQFDGALEGLAVSRFNWTICGGTLELSGTAKEGVATLIVSGLFKAESQFEVVVLNPGGASWAYADLSYCDVSLDVPAEPPEAADGPVSMLADALDGTTEDGAVEEGTAAASVSNMSEYAGKTASAMSALSNVSTVLSIVNGTFNVIKTLDSLFNWGIFPDPNEKFNKEFGKINSKLDKLDSKVNEISDGVKATMTLMIAGFKELDYNILESLMKKDREILNLFLQQYNNILITLEGTARDNKLQNLLNIESSESISEAKSVIISINYLLSCLDPYDTVGEKQDSLTYKFFLKVKADTPFYHNSAQLFIEHTKKWTAELVKYSIIVGLIYNNNILLYPEYAALYKKQMVDMTDQIKKVSYNIGKFLTEKGVLYFNALDNLVARGFERDDLNRVEYEKYVKGVLLVLNRNGKQYLFDNIGNTVAWNAPSGSVFLKMLAKNGVRYYNLNTEANFVTEFFTGPNSMFVLYGSGMTFNEFMEKHINCDRVKWLKPNDIIIESHESQGKRKDYEEALLANANATSYQTRVVTSDACLIEKTCTYARVFALKDAYSYSTPVIPSFVTNICYAVARSPADALAEMKKTTSNIAGIIETTTEAMDKKKKRVYLGVVETKNQKDAITNLFIYSSKANDAPPTYEIGESTYQKLNINLNEGDLPKYGYKWLYYTKNPDLDFPIQSLKTVNYHNLYWCEVRSESDERISLSSDSAMIQYYLYCLRC